MSVLNNKAYEFHPQLGVQLLVAEVAPPQAWVDSPSPGPLI